jgi:hypothetical protein
MGLTDILLIGVDGGATEAKTHAVACDDLEKPSSFQLRPEHASRVYPRLSDFTSLPVAEQLAQRDAGAINLTDKEVKQGRLYVKAASEAIVDVAQQCGGKRVLVGIGMPGLKTPDGRGINAMNNGPRIPDYLDALEKNLAAAGLELVSPVATLGSDADYCGLGEEYAADGLFRDVENAYYVGCGTGIADALKLRGKLVPFDAARSWIQKSWQMPSALGPTFEKLISASSLNRVYADLVEGTKGRRDEGTKGVAAGAPAGRRSAAALRYPEAVTEEARACASGSKSAATQYPEAAAAAGEPIAIGWMDVAALVLAELILERLWTIKNGRADTPHRGEAYAKLDPNHQYRGTLLDRVIVGQRVGQIYGDAAYRRIFGDKIDAYLATMIAASGDEQLATTTVVGGAHPTLRPRFIAASKLRAAPALGAAVAAAHASQARA